MTSLTSSFCPLGGQLSPTPHTLLDKVLAQRSGAPVVPKGIPAVLYLSPLSA